VPRADGAVSISPTHGIISVGPDVATNLRGVELFRQRLESARVRARLAAAREAGVR